MFSGLATKDRRARLASAANRACTAAGLAPAAPGGWGRIVTAERATEARPGPVAITAYCRSSEIHEVVRGRACQTDLGEAIVISAEVIGVVEKSPPIVFDYLADRSNEKC